MPGGQRAIPEKMNCRKKTKMSTNLPATCWPARGRQGCARLLEPRVSVSLVCFNLLYT